MVEPVTLLEKLPPYQGKKKTLLQNQTADDIISEMIVAHKKYKNDYDKIAGVFWKGNLRDTANYIFDFLKKNVKYSIEPDVRQSIKSPSAIIATGIYSNGYNDCKHYSQFISGVLDSLRRSGKNIEWNYRFANYRWYTDEPQHVFVVATDGKNEFWIDPVLKSFNERKAYINKIDKKLPMSLLSISGVNNVSGSGVSCLQPIQGMSGGIGKRKGKKGGFFKKLGKGFKFLATGVKKVSFAPSRASFFAILKLNPFKMANNLNAALDNPGKRSKLLKKWKLVGGNPKTLEKLVRKQYQHWKKRKGIKGLGGVGYVQIDGIGFVHHIIARRLHKRLKRRKQINAMRKRRRMPPLRPIPLDRARFTPQALNGIKNAEIGAVQLLALLAAAAPIIAMIAEFLPKNMKKKAEDAAKEVPADQQAAAVQSASQSDPMIRAEGRQGGGGDGDVSDMSDKSSGDTEDTGGGSVKKGFSINTNTLLIAAAATGAAIYLSKKR